LSLIDGIDSQKIEIKVCVGTNCYLKKSQKLMAGLLKYLEEKNLKHCVDLNATFCMEKCSEGPNVMIAGEHISQCTLDKAIYTLNSKLETAKLEVKRA
jgi:NADH-quinone oxidoreductase subunit G